MNFAFFHVAWNPITFRWFALYVNMLSNGCFDYCRRLIQTECTLSFIFRLFKRKSVRNAFDWPKILKRTQKILYQQHKYVDVCVDSFVKVYSFYKRDTDTHLHRVTSIYSKCLMLFYWEKREKNTKASILSNYFCFGCLLCLFFKLSIMKLLTIYFKWMKSWKKKKREKQ